MRILTHVPKNVEQLSDEIFFPEMSCPGATLRFKISVTALGRGRY